MPLVFLRRAALLWQRDRRLPAGRLVCADLTALSRLADNSTDRNIQWLQAMRDMLDTRHQDFGYAAVEFIDCCQTAGILRFPAPITCIRVETSGGRELRDDGLLVLVTVADRLTLASSPLPAMTFAATDDVAGLVLTTVAETADRLCRSLLATTKDLRRRRA
jgi:hypothetical protein